jgi:hypothetical protein
MEVIFSADSRLNEIDGFVRCTSLSRIEIPASVEKIGITAFSGCSGLTEVIFSADSRLREIDGFRECTSLSRMEIPGSVEEIGHEAFSRCSCLTEVTFEINGCLKQLSGFAKCRSLRRLEVPASVEKISPLTECCYWKRGPLGDLTRRELIFKSGTRLKPHEKEEGFSGFIIFEDENDLKRRRRQVHL